LLFFEDGCRQGIQAMSIPITIGILLWLVPLFVLPAGYFFYRYVSLRKTRYCFYAAVLVTAFFLNLFEISFWNEIWDTALVLLINFICAEFFLNLLRLKKKKLFLVLFAVALCLYAFEFKRWIIAGPQHAAELWKPYVASTYRCGKTTYAIKEHDLFDSSRPARLLVLTRQIGSWPFETTISTYRTPEGFRYTDFIYTWSGTDQGVRLDISTVGYKLWTMGEGF
jgi:hypothetical protein